MAVALLLLFMVCVIVLGRPNPDVETIYYDAEFGPLYEQAGDDTRSYAKPKQQSVTPDDADAESAPASSDGSISVDEALDLYNSIDMD